MNKTLKYILDKYGVVTNLDNAKMPLEIPNVGRDQLAELFAELNFTHGVEIGVEQGAYSEVLCKANPKLHLCGIDPWVGYRGYKEFNATMGPNYEAAKKRMAPYNCTLVREFSAKAAEAFEDDSLDFVYIDGNHNLVNVVNDIDVWLRKVRVGGIIAGHDYSKQRLKDDKGRRVKNITHHVVSAVNAFTESYGVHPWFVLGRKEKVPGEIRDKNRSWLIVKEFDHTKR